MAKKIEGYIKLQVPAGAGQSVAAHRARARSARRQHSGVLQAVQRGDAEAGAGIANPDVITSMPTAPSPSRCGRRRRRIFLKKAAKIGKGSNAPGRTGAGSVTQAQLREIAEVKMKDLNANSVEQAMKIIAGSARSMGT